MKNINNSQHQQLIQHNELGKNLKTIVSEELDHSDPMVSVNSLALSKPPSTKPPSTSKPPVDAPSKTPGYMPIATPVPVEAYDVPDFSTSFEPTFP